MSSYTRAFRNSIFVFRPPALAGRVLWNRVCPPYHPSFHPSFHLSGHSLGIVSFVFSKFWHDARNPYEIERGRAGFSRKTFLPLKIGQNCAKNRIF